MNGFAETEGEVCPDCEAGPSPERAFEVGRLTFMH